ncbi:MAG: IS200/IS605 family transposase [Chloroflexota bacterium]
MTREFKKLTHTLYQCKYHIVFCPKYRFRILTGEIGAYVYREIYRLCEQKDKVEIIEATVQADHVHMILSIPPKYSVSNIMGYLKGKLAFRVFHNHPSVKKRLWGGKLWSRGYCVSTVGIDENKIRKYVRWQEGRDKHQEQSQKRLFD